MSKNSVTVLDCTLRDGGYYNNWDFSPPLVSNYLRALDAASIDYVEIGFRFVPKKRFWGAFAYSTDDFLASLDIPETLKIGVMINASDYLSDGGPDKKLLGAFFRPASQSVVRLVRIATHFKTLDKCEGIAAYLKSLGYMVGLNIMQVASCSASELSAGARMVQSWSTVDVLYFADSMGNLSAQEVRNIVSSFAADWSGPIGIHAHDNKGLAIANTIEAISSGAKWIDGTVLGMGRGAGNAALECLLIEMEAAGSKARNLNPLFYCVADEFMPLKKEFGWGPNFLYHLAAIQNVHPTYVQQMMSDDRYSVADMVKVIANLEKDVARTYSLNSLKQQMFSGQGKVAGTWSPRAMLKNRTSAILVISGETVTTHESAIKAFIKKSEALTLSINYNNNFAAGYADAFVACHPTRLIAEAEKYKRANIPVIAPIGSFADAEMRVLNGVNLLDFGLSVSAEHYEVDECGCVLPLSSVILYALSVLSIGNVSTVYICGLDGHDVGDPRNTQTSEALGFFQKKFPKVKLVALTPTAYELEQDSVYSPGPFA